ncbi:MAG TPA: winged helix-turn-helix domain-containing protein, partial [Lysobacter sp.]|nr:winged helix-turn-helix domain-containing protein [Lysobacter sp.]
MNEPTSGLTAAGMKLSVAGFVLDLGSEQLRDAQGVPVELRPQAWAVLRHLALSASRLVTKVELLDAVWPGLVVTEGSLTQAVSDVREALGEAGHRVIKTVPKRGYMLVADAIEAPIHPSPLTNLPAEADTLIGREADVVTLTQWLSLHRLVTVLGPGGIGKTRLA